MKPVECFSFLWGCDGLIFVGGSRICYGVQTGEPRSYEVKECGKLCNVTLLGCGVIYMLLQARYGVTFSAGEDVQCVALFWCEHNCSLG